MVDLVKKANGKTRSTLFTVLNIIVILVAFGAGRAYPLPIAILAAIYFSIILGITINKLNIAKSKSEDIKRLTKEIWANVVWVVIIAIVLGLQVWIASGFQAKLANGSQTPADFASQAVQQAKSSLTLPSQVDSITTLDDITSSGNVIQYHYTLHNADTSSLSDEALKNSTKPTVCANKSTVSLLSKGVDLQYLYLASGSEQYSFTLKQSDCRS